MGFTPAEALAALQRSFDREGWRCEAVVEGAGGVFAARGADGGVVKVAVEALPDRAIGPTIRLPRSRVRVEVVAEPGLRERVEQIIRLSLHRGGG
jgi:hypothetical protein